MARIVGVLFVQLAVREARLSRRVVGRCRDA
jgi:hypothetical protein